MVLMFSHYDEKLKLAHMGHIMAALEGSMVHLGNSDTSRKFHTSALLFKLIDINGAAILQLGMFCLLEEQEAARFFFLRTFGISPHSPKL